MQLIITDSGPVACLDIAHRVIESLQPTTCGSTDHALALLAFAVWIPAAGVHDQTCYSDGGGILSQICHALLSQIRERKNHIHTKGIFSFRVISKCSQCII